MMAQNSGFYDDLFNPKQPPVADPMFVATTCRYVFYTLAMAAVGSWAGILMGIPPINPWINFAVSLGLVIKTLWESKVTGDQKSAFNWLLGFAAWTGLSISSVLAAFAVSVANGPFIIATALLITAAQTGVLTYYAYYQAVVSNQELTNFGAFCSLGLTSLLGLGVFNMVFGVPFTLLAQAVLGVGVFSAYLIYDINMVKNGGFKTPVEAALNIFLDIVNLFLEILQIVYYMKNESQDFSQHVSEFLYNRLLPILFIAGCVLSFGYLESSYEKSATTEAGLPRENAPSFWTWITGQAETVEEATWATAAQPGMAH